MKELQEYTINYIIMLTPLLIMCLVIFEIDYYRPNNTIKKNSKIKLLIDFLILVLLMLIFKRTNSLFNRALLCLPIATIVITLIDTVQELFYINNSVLVWSHKIGTRLLSIIYFPFVVRNKLLQKIYNIDIEKVDIQYLNIILIQIFFVQWVITSIIISTNIEIFLNKYFFGFAIGTFMSYFAIDVITKVIGYNDKNVKKYYFTIKKSFLIVLMMELIIIAFMANIDYDIISKLEIIKIYKLDKAALKELFDSITLCTLILQLLEYRNIQ